MKTFLTIFSALIMFSSSASYANEDYNDSADEYIEEGQEYVEDTADSVEETVEEETSEY